MHTRSIRRAEDARNGFSLLEVVIAIAILTVGVFGMAQLFVFSTYLNAMAVNTSQSLTDAEQVLEKLKISAATATSQATVDNVVKCSTTQSGEHVQDKSTISVYVLDNSGNLFPSGTSMTLPADLATRYGPGKTCAPSGRSRLVIIRVTPEHADNKRNQVSTLMGTVEMKESY